MTYIGEKILDGTGWKNNQSDGLLYLDNWLLGYKGSKPTRSQTIAQGTKAIAGGVFSVCTGLISVTIPNSVISIGNDAFSSCTGLTSVTIPNSVTSIGSSVFYNCSSLTSVTIPNSVTSIGQNAFYKSGLTSIEIPNSVTTIENWAFGHCSSLTSISIPKSVTSIGIGAFGENDALTSVTVKRETPITISSNVFSNYANATLYVPNVAAYEAAEVWTDFNEITEMSESYTMNSLGIGTYCSEYDLDFTNVSGIRAYVACGFNPTTGVVFIMHVNEVPANTGILIKGTPGTYSIPVTNSDMYYSNMFKGTLTAITVPETTNGYKNYVLLSDKLFHGSLGGSTLVANRAYLQIPLSALGGNANARAHVTLVEDNVTGIVAPEAMEQVDDGNTYNLNGQRVVSPKKGLYIRNGKKIFIY